MITIKALDNYILIKRFKALLTQRLISCLLFIIYKKIKIKKRQVLSSMLQISSEMEIYGNND